MRKNIILISISNVVFCSILVIIATLLMYNLNLTAYSLASSIVLLLTGIYNGYVTSKAIENKKFLNALASATAFLAIYFLICFTVGTPLLVPCLLALFNLYFGSFIGLVLWLNKKPKRKGFSK